MGLIPYICGLNNYQMETLTIDSSLFQQAEKYARSKKTSVTAIVENYLRNLLPHTASEGEIDQLYRVSPTFQKWEDKFTCPPNISDDYKQERGDGLIEKYL